MVFSKSLLAGLAAVVTAALVVCVLLLSGPLILRFLPHKEDIGLYAVGFPIWPLSIGALLAFCVGFYWAFRRAERRR
jgi:hypothetical protein